MRIPPLPAAEWDDAVRGALRMMPEERRTPTAAGNAIGTLVNHPDLTRPFLNFSFYLLTRSTLEPRTREMAILRVAHRTGCAYEWDEHLEIGTDAGLSADDIAAVQRSEGAIGFDGTLLTAVDELVDDARISDGTWAALSEHFDKRQLMDFVFTVGGYHMLAMALNTFGVEPKKEN